MRGRTVGVVGAVALLAAGVAPAAPARTVDAPEARFLTFVEEVPCPQVVKPTVSDPQRRTRRRPRHRVVKARAVKRAVPKLVRVRHVSRPVHRRLHWRASSAPAPQPARCTVVRRERLTAASFGVTPDVVELAPIADDVSPGGPSVALTSSGRPALPNVADPAPGGGSRSVAAAPEPSTWLLMMFGVAFVGAALRRRRRVFS